MKVLFYDDWYKRRLQKIINIFGKDWFAGKKILELGACHGDIGIELSKLGALVTFCDYRKEHLDSIDSKIKHYNFKYKTKLLNQEEKYLFDDVFDLTLHFGVLYHIQNWKQDLECAIKTSKIMLLETMVVPGKVPDSTNKVSFLPDNLRNYHGVEPIMSMVSQESIENQLTKNDTSFIRFDNQDLNSDVSWGGSGNNLIQHIYNWDYQNTMRRANINGQQISIHHRRFWLVMSK